MRVQLSAWEALMRLEEAAVPPLDGRPSRLEDQDASGNRRSQAAVVSALASSGLGRLAALPTWTGSPRAKRTGSAVVGYSAEQSSAPASAARLIENSALFRSGHAQSLRK